MSVIKMTDLDLAGKRVFIRADLNVPVKEGKVTSDARIRASCQPSNWPLKQGAKVMVTSHLVVLPKASTTKNLSAAGC